MQMVLQDNPKFFKHLEHWRREIRARRNDAPPIGIGARAQQLNPRDYTLMTYHKGAWVLQMLRNMMLDFRTMREDAFATMMQDFYQTYRGKRATTADFQRVVERHMGLNMGWFFDEWVNRTEIPKYTLSWHADTAPDHGYALRIRIRQEDVPADFVMPVPLRIELAGGGPASRNRPGRLPAGSGFVMHSRGPVRCRRARRGCTSESRCGSPTRRRTTPCSGPCAARRRVESPRWSPACRGTSGKSPASSWRRRPPAWCGNRASCFAASGAPRRPCGTS